ncbi:ester cyclase [Mucilaginibacter sp. BJC16-A38]|uniref:ester cyclase n=1 Tax=Mucilaginibacter phenanthrenivorans TaxID=1234842 RepID=UPI00215786CB|nr:ester cyclase [Mucilaginibacter phenanthrenivorans]MCR8556041.1 ester cyclase [Mucilaginibacter phenanthrenivorans]
MTEQEKQNKEVVLRFNREVLEKGSIDAINEIIHPDFVNYTAPGSARGPQGIIDFTISIMHKALKDIKVEIHDQVFEDDKVVTRKTISGTHVDTFMGIAPSGKRGSINIIDIITVNNGQYTEHWSIRDISGLVNPLPNN